MERPQTDPLAIASIVCGLLSWMLGCCGGFFGLFGLPITIVAFVLAVVAIVCGGMSIRRVNAEPALFTGKELGIVGLVMGSLGLLAGVALVVLMMLGVGAAVLGGALQGY